MSWNDTPQGKEYNRKKSVEYHNRHKDDPEYKARRKAAQQKYYWSHREKLCQNQRKKYEEKQEEDYDDKCTVTKEEWLKRYGYPMGDTSGWEHWLGWDTRIRRYED